MFRTILFILILVLTHTTVDAAIGPGRGLGPVSAAQFVPGNYIDMTGSNTSVRFDIASELYGYDAYSPYLMSSSRDFVGTFYGSGIGWVMFSTGTYQVSLDCGAQSLSTLTVDCTLSGTGWSELMGDVGFGSVTYDHTTGLLIGYATTYAGDIDLTNIALPLLPAKLNQTTIATDHIATLSITNAWIYGGGLTSWQIRKQVMSLPITTTYTIGDSAGIFSGIDLSLATVYQVRITDTNYSTTDMLITVLPSALSTTLETAPYAADSFCVSNPAHTACPDGNMRSPTTMMQAPITGPLANGTDSYLMKMMARDRYGNRISTGIVDIKYTTSVKNIQTIFGDNMSYIPSNDGDAVVGDFANIFGERTRTYSLGATDISYTIASTAPTNMSNQINLESVLYNSIDITLPVWKNPLNFAPIFSASVSSLAPVIGSPHSFATTVTGTHPTLVPTTVTTLAIGDGSSAEWRDLMSTPIAECANYPFTIATSGLCDWRGVSSIATRTAFDYTYTGTYTNWVANPPLQSTQLKTYIYYNSGGTDVLYGVPDSTLPMATAVRERMHVLGQSGEGISGSPGSRADLINSVRKETALLSRNRFVYTDTDYIVYGSDQIVRDTDFDTKRTIIVVGADIHIAENILIDGDHPLTMIALADTKGIGGNIIIDASVTDIHSSLIAEHGIISARSDSQLYLHGSIVSANPPREIAPTGCPYYAPSGCVRSDYDLPDMRSGYAILSDKTLYMSTGGSAYDAPLVIESDPRLLRDPSPGLNRP